MASDLIKKLNSYNQCGHHRYHRSHSLVFTPWTCEFIHSFYPVGQVEISTWVVRIHPLEKHDLPSNSHASVTSCVTSCVPIDAHLRVITGDRAPAIQRSDYSQSSRLSPSAPWFSFVLASNLLPSQQAAQFSLPLPRSLFSLPEK